MATAPMTFTRSRTNEHLKQRRGSELFDIEHFSRCLKPVNKRRALVVHVLFSLLLPAAAGVVLYYLPFVREMLSPHAHLTAAAMHRYYIDATSVALVLFVMLSGILIIDPYGETSDRYSRRILNERLEAYCPVDQQAFQILKHEVYRSNAIAYEQLASWIRHERKAIALYERESVPWSFSSN